VARILVTGTAGFIGFHLARRLIEAGHFVTGVDNLSPYYDVRLKEARHALLSQSNLFRKHMLDICDAPALRKIVEDDRTDIVIHLAAQAGVRYALEHPDAYVQTNVVGTFNILELCRAIQPRHVLIASTSSAYGANAAMPFRETDRSAHPLTIYAATKGAAELMSHSYAHLWRIPTTVFRFFTVYGPWGRPDMAYFKFVDAILAGRPIDVYNHGDLERDFTYVDDLVEGIVRLIDCAPEIGKPVSACDSLSPVAPWRLVNIGRGEPVRLLDFIGEIEKCLGRKAELRMLDMQPGDAPKTFASAELLQALTGYRPATPLSVGMKAFVEWHRAHMGEAARRR
jgi:UDP-glucuronate 4-epimerase